MGVWLYGWLDERNEQYIL